ncbi:MAG: hypothetical protein PHX08_01310 [Lachnospiraceae bacterium]|nr:hypothetical protein [Lachnospiraceae bacterium]
MTLSEEDGKLYYELWLPLLDFVNRKYGVKKQLKKMETAKNLNPEDVKAVSDKLCENISVIDEYLQEHKEISEEQKSIIESWKRFKRGRFIIERHLKGGSMMISMEDENVYQVVGIITSIEEMFYYAPMPLMVEATLMPFRNLIITDGLIMPYNLMIGGNVTRTFKDVYMNAKKAGTIKKSL